MMSTPPKLAPLVLFLIAVAAVPYAAAEDAVVVGSVALLKGEATRRSPNGVEHVLRVDDEVFLGDHLETAGRSMLALRLRDDTRFFLGPKAALSVDEFRFGAGDDVGLSARIVKGAFRFVTGLVAKRRARSMQVRTGVVATIGLRGTTVGGEVVGESATVVLLESEDHPETPSAIEVGNEHGSVVIDKTGYGTRVPDAQSPPTPPERMRLRAVENLARNIQSIQRVPVPRPRMH